MTLLAEIPQTSVPLHSTQQMIWFDQLLSPDTPRYTIGGYLLAQGKIATDQLIRALERAAAETALFQARVQADEHGLPMWNLDAPVKRSASLKQFSGSDADQQARGWMQARMHEPVAFSPVPQVDLVVLEVGPETAYLFLRTHHLLADGVAFKLFFDRVIAALASETGDEIIQGGRVRKAAQPDEFPAVVELDQAYLAGEDYAEDRAYWLSRWPSLPPSAFPRIHATLPCPATSGQQIVAMPEELRASLRRLAEETGTSTIHAIHLALALCLRRGDMQTDEGISIGVTLHNRSSRAERSTVSALSNTVASCVRLDRFATVRSLLTDIRDDLRRDMRHRRYSVSHLAREHGQSGLDRALPFDITVNYNMLEPSVHVADVRFDRWQLSNLSEELPLHAKWCDRGDQGPLELHLDHELRCVSPDEARRFIDRLFTVLARLEDSLGLHPCSVSRLLPDEDLGLQSTPLPDEVRKRTVHALFEAQVRARPDSIALQLDGEQLSYAALDARANAVAHSLRARGVRSGDVVGVCMPRSIPMVVSLLGILKAGGAYLMLDPSQPAERLAFMAGDSQARYVLSEAAWQAQAGALPVQVLDYADMLAGGHAGALPSLTGDALLCVMYTSGSTGRPKGTLIPHRAVPGFFWNVPELGFDSEAVTLQYAATSWDVLTLELWTALLSGGRCVLYGQDQIDVAEIARLVHEHAVNTLWMTSSFFNTVAEGEFGWLGALRTLMIGGEAISAPHAQRVLRALPGLRLVNGYGPSECTVFSSCQTLNEEVLADAARGVPIGRPVGDRSVYLLDAWHQPVPAGAVGELCVGGDALADGYLGRPALSAERFVPHPWADGERLYRTGDLARLRPDGLLEFAGRVDDQIKLRGFRIELGEVEHALRALDGVAEAAVLVREDRPGDRRLVGYLVADEADDAWRDALAQSLPHYMVPQHLLVLERLPLTRNGKLDRQALPAPDHTAQGQSEAPATPLECVVAEVWAQVLGLPSVGALDDFFALGGHSLLATQAVARLRERLQRELPLRALFEARTVRALALRLQQAAELDLPPIAAAPSDQPLPLSFAQQRLWFIDRFDEGGGAQYNVPAALRLRGALDAGALAWALGEVVQRHQVLRTHFEEIDGVPVQCIDPDWNDSLRVEDLSGLAQDERMASMHQAVCMESLMPFDLERGPMLRARLLVMDPHDHVLLLTMHHIATDGWSMAVLADELSQLVEARRKGLDNPLAPLPLQYADYACWQRRWLDGERLETQLQWWRGQLQGMEPLHALPLDRPRPAQAGEAPAGVLNRSLPAALVQALDSASQARGATLFMGLHAVFSAWMARFTGRPEVVVGSPVANREQDQVARLIGFFVNTLVLRTQVAPQATLAQLIDNSRELALGAYAHQQVPFELLVGALQPERSAAHAPLCQVVLVLQNNREAALQLGDVAVEVVPGIHPPAKYDLSLVLGQGPEGLSCSWEYRADLFDESSIAAMADSFETLTAALVAQPGTPLHALPMMSPQQQAALLEQGQGKVLPAEVRQSTVPALFEAQVRARPDGIALQLGGQQLSYAELDARANSVAHALRAHGLRCGDVVGVYMPRSIPMVVSLLGILKAGGAYLMLDPAQPAERLAFMARDSQARCVLTEAAWRAQACALPVEVLDFAALSGPVHALDLPLSPEASAYCIYTSGSTGQPKGMHIPHRAIPGFFWQVPDLGFDGAATTLQYSSTLWDALTLELWPVLCTGGRCVIYDAEQAEGAEIARHVKEYGVDTLLMTSTFFNAVVDHDIRHLAGLRTIMVGGEQLSSVHARKALDAYPGLRLLNGYGPCETTVIATTQRLTPALLAGAAIAPIGRPVGDRSVYLLDAWHRPVPAGAVGELCVGGDALAGGYLGQPALTAERFVPHPWADGERLYRTGDLARLRSDGLLEFAGRVDDQVKLRGFRIELGEVEHALRALPGVAEAAVLVREDRPGDRRLVGYLVAEGPHDDAAGAIARWRAELAQTLPRYMVPQHLLLLSELPLTANGKLDRRCLRQLPLDALTGAAGEAPRTATEQALAALWQQLLGLSQLPHRDANFFDLGGHSMLAVRSLSLMREDMQAEVQLRWMYEAPTLEALAAKIDHHKSGRDNTAPGSSQETAIMLAGDIDAPPLFLVHPVGGTVWPYARLASQLGSHYRVIALQQAATAVANGELAVYAEHMADIVMQLQPEGDLRLAGWSTGGLLARTLASALEARGRVLAYLGLIDVQPVPATLAGADGQGDLTHALAALLSSLRPDATPVELLSLQSRVGKAGLDAGSLLDARNDDILQPVFDAWIGNEMPMPLLRGMLAAIRRQLAWWAHEGAAPAIRVQPHRIVASESPPCDALAWQQVTGNTQPARLDTLAASHHSLLLPPHVADLAACMHDELARSVRAAFSDTTPVMS